MNTKIIPLGGLGEVGKNMYTVMHGDEIIMSILVLCFRMMTYLVLIMLYQTIHF